MRRSLFRLSATTWRRLGAAGLVLAHVAWVALGRGPDGRVRALMDLVPRPILGLSGWWEEHRVASSMEATTLAQAQTELDILRARLKELNLAQQQQGERLAEADEALRLLGLQRVLPLQFRAARVLANLRRAPFGGLILNQGAQAGFQPDQGVLCSEGVVGRLWAVSTTQSSVLPLDAYNASTAVMLGRSRATGILHGSGPGKAYVRYISAQEQVQVGEPILTSGLDQVFPRGLLVGWVSGVSKGEVELSLDVSLAAPLDRLALVLVLPPAPRLELQAPAPDPQAKAPEGAAPAGRTP